MSQEPTPLHPEGLYNPSLRFAFTNITDEVFTSAWDGSPIVVQPGDTIELPQYLAVKLTGEMVDNIMINEVKMDEIKYHETHPGTPIYAYQGPSSLGVPAARKVWEDRICRQMDVDEESPQLQVMRAQIKAELEADLNPEIQKATDLQVPTSIEEFADLTDPHKTAPKAPLKVKKVTVKK